MCYAGHQRSNKAQPTDASLHLYSRDIIIRIVALIISFHVVFVDQPFCTLVIALESRHKRHSLLNVLLDVCRIQNTSRLGCSDHLRYQFCMSDLLPALHYPHNGSLCFVVAISSDTLMSLLVLGLCLFGLDLIYLDAVFGMGKGKVDGESVMVVDLFAFWALAENTITSACE